MIPSQNQLQELEQEIQKVKDETEEEQITLDEKVNNLAVEANMILSTKDDILREVSQAEQDLVYTVTVRINSTSESTSGLVHLFISPQQI